MFYFMNFSDTGNRQLKNREDNTLRREIDCKKKAIKIHT